MTVLQMRIENNIIGVKDLLLRIRNALSAFGWNEDNYLTDKIWDNPTSGYEFVDGLGAGEDYLLVNSAGFGSQSLFYRLGTDPDSGDAQSATICLGAHLNATLDTGNSQDPVLRNKWNNDEFHSFPVNGFDTAWMFGNDRFFYMCAKVASDYVEHMSFGTPELFDNTITQGNFCGYTRGTLNNNRWHNKNANPPFDGNGENFYFNNERKSNSEAGQNFTCNGSGNGISHRKFCSYGNMMTTNPKSEKQPPVKQLIYMEDSVDSKWFELGQFYVYRYRFDGLQIGESVFFGSEEYKVFPHSRIDYLNGIAVKIS